MIVMKFGGTSVEDTTAIDRVASIVTGRLPQRPVVVVSAMAKITDQLVAAGQAACAGQLHAALERVTLIRERHQKTARELVGPSADEKLIPAMNELIDQLETLLRGVAAVGELSERTSDAVLSFGERLSSMMVPEAFRVRGLDAVHVDSRQCVITDNSFTHALPLWDKTNERTKATIQPLLDAGNVPVMGGFIGSTVDGITSTLGRGGSDFSAAIVGAALDAKCIEIWTDVEGMMTTDPRICPAAQSISVISFDEAAEMAHFGAKVLHPATLVPAVEKNIPVYVLNSRNLNSVGTCITKTAPPCKTQFRAIAAKKGMTIISVSTPRRLAANGFLKAVFSAFDRYHIPIDMISSSEASLSLTIESKYEFAGLVADLRELAQVTVEEEKAIVCLIGADVRGRVGIAAKIFGTLAQNGVNMRMISQGASEINVGFVINEGDVPEAVRHLHAAFFEEASETATAGGQK
jgi:aspartate kinase